MFQHFLWDNCGHGQHLYRDGRAELETIQAQNLNLIMPVMQVMLVINLTQVVSCSIYAEHASQENIVVQHGQVMP